MKPVGIYGIGVYLPAEIRRNDWWGPDIVEKWAERVTAKLDRPAEHGGERSSEGARLVLEAMAALRGDPFRGARERRIMPEKMRTSDMEIRAARDAIEKSGVDPQKIDLLLSTTNVPDYLMLPNACRVHKELGLAPQCLTLQTEGICNAFNLQLALAEQMIAGGRARCALLIQSAATSRFLLREDPMSAWCGDGAAAEVVGPVSEGRGILGRCHHTDGTYYEGLVVGIPEKLWYEEGRVHAYFVDAQLSRRLLLETVGRSAEVIDGALKDAGCSAADIDFYAAHQGFAWLRRVTQQLAHLDRARSLDTFAWAGSLLGANIPLVLATAEQEGLLRDGDLVTTFAGASGALLSSLVMRWGH